MNSKNLTKNEIAQTIKLLRKLTLGSIPYDIFVEICRLTVAPVIDIVPIVILDNQPEVILIKRPQSDKCFSGLYHIPGSVLNPTDKKGSFETIFERIYKKDMKGIKPIVPPQFIDFNFYESNRGSEFSLLHWALFPKNITDFESFSFDDLPKDVIPHQIEFIRKAKERFNNYTN